MIHILTHSDTTTQTTYIQVNQSAARTRPTYIRQDAQLRINAKSPRILPIQRQVIDLTGIETTEEESITLGSSTDESESYDEYSFDSFIESIDLALLTDDDDDFEPKPKLKKKSISKPKERIFIDLTI